MIRCARRPAAAGLRSILSAFAAAALVAALGARPAAAQRRVPFEVGEQLSYRATFGTLRVGTARMRVEGIEVVRGRPAYHLFFTLDGGLPLFRVRDRYESWLDTVSFVSLRYRQEINEGRYHKVRAYEIFPERASYRSVDEENEQPGVREPLDDGSFVYVLRLMALRLGETRSVDRYFIADRNPVRLAAVRRDTVEVEAGRYATLVVQPSVKARGIFGEDGRAELWFSDDERRLLVQIKSRFSAFTLGLSLQSVQTPTASMASAK